MGVQNLILAGLAASVLMGAPAKAQNISQTFDSTQTIQQIARAAAEVLHALDEDNSTQGSIDQHGINAANVIQSEGDLQHVVQLITGTQIIENDAAFFGNDDTLSQYGMNITGVVEARTIESATQTFATGAAQWVQNNADVVGDATLIEQIGVNAANFATAEYAIGTANQTLEPGSLQKVENIVSFIPGGGSSEIVQSGTNLGNMLEASKIDNVTRIFASSQIIENTIYLDSTTPGSVHQSGTNVANYIDADVVGRIVQVTKGGTQTVSNTVYDANGEEITGADWLTQEAINMVNVMVIGGQDRGETVDGLYINGELQVTQEADYPQSSAASGPQSQYGNVLTINK